jgi:hypothetical protein
MPGTFRNVNLCEDVRNETGNKKSLMGVFSGDILVAEFPAQLRVAFYAEYVPQAGTTEHKLSLILSLGKEPVTIEVVLNTPNGQVAIIVVPQGIATFKEPSDLTLSTMCQGETEVLLHKRVMLMPSSS